MPLYDYECRNCGHRVEVLHGINDPGPTACERCGGTVRKLFSTPAIVFKGSGFAKKDFRDARSAAAKADKKEPVTVKPGESASSESPSSSPTSDGTAKSDSPPAAKSTDGAAKAPPTKDSSPAKAAD